MSASSRVCVNCGSILFPFCNLRPVISRRVGPRRRRCVPYPGPVALRRQPLLANDELTGAMWCRAHSRLIDEWLAGLLHDAVGDTASGLALVAVGGYGR